MIKNDYTDPCYIGSRFGNLTVLEYMGGCFKVKCDCGFEKVVKCSAVAFGKSTTCGRFECEYHHKAMNYMGKHGELVRQAGERTEQEVYDLLRGLGYKISKTKTSGDYGVDLIAIGRDGSRVAIQVKNHEKTKDKTSVRAVQEVYAGGVFYNCKKFAVVSYTGYTDNARKMAKKLGVLLLNEKCTLYDFTNDIPINTKNFWIVNGKREPMVVTFRREGWNCNHAGRFAGQTYEQVKAHYDKIALKRSRVEERNEKGISGQMIHYRMTKMGMTYEQAISEPKKTMGRPRKVI